MTPADEEPDPATSPAASRRVHVVRVTAPAADADVVVDALWAAGAAGIEERHGPAGAVVLVAGPPGGVHATALLEAVAGRWLAELVPVDPDAALDAWRPWARAVRVGRVVVRPPWVVPPADARPGAGVDVVIDPGRAFGSGAHASTGLALAALADRVPAGGRVLDVGCGSGVLAVAAVLLGAGEAVALDSDPAAVAATRANAAANGVADRVTAIAGDAVDPAASGAAGWFDVVVANMLSPELVAAAPLVGRAVSANGTVVLSGLLARQRDAVVEAYAAVGLHADPAGPAPGPGAPDDVWVAVVLGR